MVVYIISIVCLWFLGDIGTHGFSLNTQNKSLHVFKRPYVHIEQTTFNPVDTYSEHEKADQTTKPNYLIFDQYGDGDIMYTAGHLDSEPDDPIALGNVQAEELHESLDAVSTPGHYSITEKAAENKTKLSDPPKLWEFGSESDSSDESILDKPYETEDTFKKDVSNFRRSIPYRLPSAPPVLTSNVFKNLEEPNDRNLAKSILLVKKHPIPKKPIAVDELHDIPEYLGKYIMEDKLQKYGDLFPHVSKTRYYINNESPKTIPRNSSYVELNKDFGDFISRLSDDISLPEPTSLFDDLKTLKHPSRPKEEIVKVVIHTRKEKPHNSLPDYYWKRYWQYNSQDIPHQYRLHGIDSHSKIPKYLEEQDGEDESELHDQLGILNAFLNPYKRHEFSVRLDHEDKHHLKNKLLSTSPAYSNFDPDELIFIYNPYSREPKVSPLWKLHDGYQTSKEFQLINQDHIFHKRGNQREKPFELLTPYDEDYSGDPFELGKLIEIRREGSLHSVDDDRSKKLSELDDLELYLDGNLQQIENYNATTLPLLSTFVKSRLQRRGPQFRRKMPFYEINVNSEEETQEQETTM